MPKIRNWFDRKKYIEECNTNDNMYIELCGLHESEDIKLKEYEGLGDGSGVRMDAYNMLLYCKRYGSMFESTLGFCVDRFLC